MLSTARAQALDGNGMSALNHARYQLDNCDEFKEMQRSGMVEHDYVDQILEGRTRHTQQDIADIRNIRAAYANTQAQLKKARRYRFRDTLDLYEGTEPCDDCDAPFTKEFYEISAHYLNGALLRIEWIRSDNYPKSDTTTAYFDKEGKAFFAFVRTDDQVMEKQYRYYYRKGAERIATSYRGRLRGEDCLAKKAPIEKIRNYPNQWKDIEDPLQEIGMRLVEMECTAKREASCDYFDLAGMRDRRRQNTRH